MRILAATCVVFFACTGTAVAAPRNDQFPLHPGSHGPRVAALQWLLHGGKPAAFKYGYFKPKPNGLFGPRTAAALKDTKWRLGYPVNAAKQPVATELFFRIIEHKVNRPLAWRIAAGNRVNRATPFHPKPLPTKAQTLVADARYLISQARLVHYSQRTRMQIVLLHLRLPPLTRQIYEDCSSSTTGLYRLAGLPDPNGFDYNGQGFTGTQSEHGRVVWRLGQPLTLLRPGDLIFYGRGSFSHVTMYLGSGRVFSHGSEGGPYDLPVAYRGDAFYARRYFN